jgi:hypothetical protein
MSTIIAAFLLSITITKAATPLNCTAANFTDPSSLSSTEKLCTAEIEEIIPAEVGTITAFFKPSYIPSIQSADREGKEIFSSFLSGSTPSGSKLQKYAITLAFVVIPAVGFLFLNLCCCFCCSCCHTFCKCCHYKCCHLCKCIPKTTGSYGTCSTCYPLLWWLVLSLTMCAAGSAGAIQGLFKLNDSMVKSVCIFDDVYIKFNAFLNNVKSPLDQLNTNFQRSVEELKEAAIQDPQLSENVRNIGNAFESVSEQAKKNMENIDISSPYKKACDTVWDNLITQCGEAKMTITTDAKKIDQTLIDVQVQIQTSVVDASVGATQALSSGSNTIGLAQKQVKVLLNPRTYNLITYSSLLRENRVYGGVGGFGWIMIPVFFGFLSFIFMKCCRKRRKLKEGEYKSNPNLEGHVIQLSRCFGSFAACFCGCICSWWLVLLFGILSSVLAIVFSLIATIGSDACLVVPNLPQQLGVLSGNEQVTQITDTCWNRTGNLFSGLGLDKQIKLDGINFTEFKEQFSNNGVEINKDSVSQLKSTIETIDLNCYNNSIPLLNKTVNCVNWIIKNISYAENAFNTNPSAGLLSASGEKLISQVKCAINDFKVGTGCYFVAETWEDAMKVLCDDTIDSFHWIGTAELLIATVAVPYALTMMCIMKRMGGHGPIKSSHSSSVDDDGRDNDSDSDSNDDAGYTVHSKYKQKYSSSNEVQEWNIEDDSSDDDLDSDEILKWSKNRKVQRAGTRNSQYTYVGEMM